jgi:hypothetical protein
MYLPAISQIALDLGTTPARVSMSISSYFIGLGAGQDRRVERFDADRVGHICVGEARQRHELA